MRNGRNERPPRCRNPWLPVRELLDSYIVPPPPVSFRDAALAAAHRRAESPDAGAWRLMRQALAEVRFLPLWYYGASLALAACGVALLLFQPREAQQLGMLAGMAPLPLLLGLVELFRGPDQGMAEIEAACRYSPSRVMSARMLVIGGMSATVCLALSLCARSLPPLLAAAMTVVPFCLSASFGLTLSWALHGKADSAQTAIAAAAVNGAAAGTLSLRFERICAVSAPGWLTLMAVSALCLAAALRLTLRMSGRAYERMMAEWN